MTTASLYKNNSRSRTTKSHANSINIDEDESSIDDHQQSDSDGYPSTEYGIDNDKDIVDEQNQHFATHETRAIKRLRYIFAMILVACSVLVAVGVYKYTSGSEQNAFEKAFSTDANKVLEAIGKSLDKTMGSIDAYATSLISYTRAANQTWPWIYVPDFPVRTAKVLGLSDSIYIGVFPLVTQETRAEWEAFSLEYGGDMVNQSIQYQETDPNYHGPIYYNYTVKGEIHHDFFDIPLNETRPMLPTWQAYPVVPRWPPFNWDLASTNYVDSIYKAMDNRQAVMTSAYNIISGELSNFDVEEIEAWTDYYTDYVAPDVDASEPISDLIYPLVNDMSAIELNPDKVDETSIVGVLEVVIYWRDLMKDTLKEGSDGIFVVFKNQCAASFTYQVNGPTVVYLGVNDLHEPEYDNMRVTGGFAHLEQYSVRDSTYTGLKLNDDYCQTIIHVYPSNTMEAAYTTGNPVLFTCVTVLIFILTSASFLLYDWMVERRQRVVMSTAIRSSAIVSSLFPSNVRDQLEIDNTNAESRPVRKGNANKSRLQSFLIDGDVTEEKEQAKSLPIAELFPDTTVLFADIAGFTAWSSQRDPIQVFTLLETLYGAFDYIAEKRGVFKVETIGDCYVAVVGLPRPRRQHALIAARFANDCLQEMAVQTRLLEKELGPGTRGLSLRIGLNSGPTTAGVLRGQKARFQLFGDTVNTSARMESNGEKGRIHCSQQTADLIATAGKSHWLTIRADLVEAKGKGAMQTFWVCPNSRTSGGSSSRDDSGYSETCDDDGHGDAEDDMTIELNRYVAWAYDTFEDLLRVVVASRSFSDRQCSTSVNLSTIQLADTPLQEVFGAFEFPKFDAGRRITESVPVLEPKVSSQLREYISMIARTYRSNRFHSFSRANHVLLATKKLVEQVVKPKGYLSLNANSSWLGFASEPTIKLSILFAALCLDCDHPGIPNGSQLIMENPTLAARYGSISITEQISLDTAFDLLMMDSLEDLQRALFATEAEFRRFRQIVVRAVMATDTSETESHTLREKRWKELFCNSSADNDCGKVLAVLECIIQAADVSHCMQHWEVYQKWSRCLFEEMYAAFVEGRSDKDPSIGWDKRELLVFDSYVIPLAKKLKECGVFGVSCNEFLDYANDNREEVANKGSIIVQKWLSEIRVRASQHAAL